MQDKLQEITYLDRKFHSPSKALPSETEEPLLLRKRNKQNSF